MSRLPLVPKNAIRGQSWITCPNCQEKHGLFYRRHDAKRRTLHYFCDKVERHTVKNRVDDYDQVRFCTMMGQVEFVDNLPIREEWTVKCKQDFQETHTGDLLK